MADAGTQIKSTIEAECRRIEEDSEYSFKAHYNAADRWSWVNLAMGLPAAICGAVAGGTALAEGAPLLVTGGAFLGSALTACLTFLKPGEKSDHHKNAGHLYQKLRNQTRLFRELDLSSETDEIELKKQLKQLANRRDELNATMPAIPRWAYKQAKTDIEAGHSTYQVNKETSA